MNSTRCWFGKGPPRRTSAKYLCIRRVTTYSRTNLPASRRLVAGLEYSAACARTAYWQRACKKPTSNAPLNDLLRGEADWRTVAKPF